MNLAPPEKKNIEPNPCFLVLGRDYLGPLETSTPLDQILAKCPLTEAQPGFSQGGSNFFPCIVATRVRKITFTRAIYHTAGFLIHPT